MKDKYVVGKKVTKNGCKMAKLEICHFFYGPVFKYGNEQKYINFLKKNIKDLRKCGQQYRYLCTGDKH